MLFATFVIVKRLASISLLIILVCNAGGFYLYFVVELGVIKKEMRAELKKLPDEKLLRLKLSNAFFGHAKVEEDEIRINGRMYDVARTVAAAGDSVFVYCLRDEREENVLAFLAEILGKPLKERKTFPETILRFISLNYIAPVSPSVEAQAINTRPGNTPYRVLFHSPDLTHATPPPWFLSA